jgi:hypothetical protein
MRLSINQAFVKPAWQAEHMLNAASQPAGRVRADSELKLESATGRPGVDHLESLAHLSKFQEPNQSEPPRVFFGGHI